MMNHGCTLLLKLLLDEAIELVQVLSCLEHLGDFLLFLVFLLLFPRYLLGLDEFLDGFVLLLALLGVQLTLRGLVLHLCNLVVAALAS